MDATDCYRPTEQDLDLFRQVKEYTNQHRGRFVEIAIELDRRYGSDEIRKRNARERRAVWLDKSLSRNTRAMYRRLGYDITHMIPAKRCRDADGILQRPRKTLVKRFELAWSDTFDNPANIKGMPWRQRESEALRRVLLVWLRCDPDRGRKPWLTAFQQLVTRPTDSGLPPSYRPDYEPAMSIDALWIRRDGGLDPEAPRWIAAVADAIVVLTGMPGLGLFVHAVDVIHTVNGHLVALEDIPGRDICPERCSELAREKERCIAVLCEARRRVEQMRLVFGVDWTRETKEMVSRLELAVGAMARALRVSKALGWTHPIPHLGGADEDTYKKWNEHDSHMRAMMHVLPTLDYGEEASIPQASKSNTTDSLDETQPYCGQSFKPTKTDLEILEAIRVAPATVTQGEIEAGSGHPLKTIKARLPILEKAGKVHRPHGPRKGYAIKPENT